MAISCVVTEIVVDWVSAGNSLLGEEAIILGGNLSAQPVRKAVRSRVNIKGFRMWQCVLCRIVITT